MSINDIKTNPKRHEKEKKNIETAMPNVYKIQMFDDIRIVRRGKNVSFLFIFFRFFFWKKICEDFRLVSFEIRLLNFFLMTTC